MIPAKVTEGGLFVCIVGTQRDSHDLAADAAAKSAGVLAIQHPLGEACWPGCRA